LVDSWHPSSRLKFDVRQRDIVRVVPWWKLPVPVVDAFRQPILFTVASLFGTLPRDWCQSAAVAPKLLETIVNVSTPKRTRVACEFLVKISPDRLQSSATFALSRVEIMSFQEQSS
jgi:hypothetical protein